MPVRVSSEVFIQIYKMALVADYNKHSTNNTIKDRDGQHQGTKRLAVVKHASKQQDDPFRLTYRRSFHANTCKMFRSLCWHPPLWCKCSCGSKTMCSCRTVASSQLKDSHVSKSWSQRVHGPATESGPQSAKQNQFIFEDNQLCIGEMQVLWKSSTFYPIWASVLEKRPPAGSGLAIAG